MSDPVITAATDVASESFPDLTEQRISELEATVAAQAETVAALIALLAGE